jgi:hypothetical protein
MKTDHDMVVPVFDQHGKENHHSSEAHRIATLTTNLSPSVLTDLTKNNELSCETWHGKSIKTVVSDYSNKLLAIEEALVELTSKMESSEAANSALRESTS